jgi:hypothetical protein
MKGQKECHVCQLMNAEDADTCKHCGTAFFFELECLEPKFDDPDDELMVVARCANILDAHMVKGLLEEHDIAACVPEELSLRLPWAEAATVQVRARDLQTARQILGERNP